MMVNHYECDECGTRTRRITVHTSEMHHFQAVSDLHFCGLLCMDTWRAGLVEIPANEDPDMYWLNGEDIRDGA
jgi:hypothetical protein